MFDVSRTLRNISQPLIKWPVKTLVAFGVAADQLTVAGFYLAMIASSVIIGGNHITAATIFILAGACDVLDGAVARVTNTSNPSGAFLDSVLDRSSDLVPYLAIVGTASWHHQLWLAITGSAALVVSVLISYSKARGEALGCRVEGGLMIRPLRYILLITGLFSGTFGLTCCLALIALGGGWTVNKRMRSCLQQLRQSSQ